MRKDDRKEEMRGWSGGEIKQKSNEIRKGREEKKGKGKRRGKEKKRRNVERGEEMKE